MQKKYKKIKKNGFRSIHERNWNDCEILWKIGQTMGKDCRIYKFVKWGIHKLKNWKNCKN